MANTPKRKNTKTPPSSPSRSTKRTPSPRPKSANKSPSPPPRSMTPRTKAVESVVARMSLVMNSPERRKKAVRRALNFTENTLDNMKAASTKAVQNAIKRAKLAKSIKTPFQIHNELQKKMTKNKNKGKK
jgi:flavin-binding protein dodecin